MSQSKTFVLVTGVGGGGIGSQILKALRLSKLDLHIIGTDTTAASTGASEVNEFFVVPLAKDPGYIKSILEIAGKKRVQIIFPGSEPELMVFANNREHFTNSNIVVPINSLEVINICLDKYKTAEFLSSNGFVFPRSVKVKDAVDLEQIDFFPVIVKPNTGGSGSGGVMIAQNREELKTFVSFLLNVNADLVIQEYVGDPQSEYTVGVLSSLEGELINSIAVHREIETGLGNKIRVRNHTGRTELGKSLVVSSGISQGKVGRFSEVTSQCEKIAEAIGSKGPLNIQCRFVDGKVYVFEINPRYSGTTPLRAMVGFNEPEIMIRKYILHETIEARFPYEEKLILRTLKEVIVG